MTTQTEQLLKAWVPAGYRLLQEVAGRYDATITSAELAAAVQERTGRTSPTSRPTWLTQLLELVATQANRTGDAPLASLCVGADGSVGDRYVTILMTSGAPLGTGDLERRAAEDRLECYRRYAADLPEDGGRINLSPKAKRSRSTGATKAKAPKPVERPAPKVCPSCFMQLPATGVCDSCG